MKMRLPLIVIGSLALFFAMVYLVVMLPAIIFQPQPTDTAHPYEGQVALGRQVYKENGCVYCHTQFVRPQDWPYGRVSDPGDSFYDSPHFFGTERTGPDLSQIGSVRTEGWNEEHLRDPRSTSPGSIMPPFDFLSQKEVDALEAYLDTLGESKNEVRRPLEHEWAGSTTKEPVPEEPYAGMESPLEPTREDIHQGKALYTVNCAPCHGFAGNGNGRYAARVPTPPAPFVADHFKGLEDDVFFWRVSEGVPGTIMPPWKKTLSEEERWQVISYLKTFTWEKRGSHEEGHMEHMEAPPPYEDAENPYPGEEESVKRGKDIYFSFCYVCHGYAGRGNGPDADHLAVQPADFTSMTPGMKMEGMTMPESGMPYNVWFARASEGVNLTNMPVWKEILTEKERWDMVNYIVETFVKSQVREGMGHEHEKEVPQKYKGYDNPFSYSAKLYDRGKEIYFQRCYYCHGYAGRGNGPDAWALQPKPTNFVEAEDLKDAPDSEFIWRVSEGVEGTAMPRWKYILPEWDRWAVITYIQNAFINPPEMEEEEEEEVPVKLREAANPYGPTERNLEEGKEIYFQRCYYCHGYAGRGNGPEASTLSPSPANFTSRQHLEHAGGEEGHANGMHGLPTQLDSLWFWLLSNGASETSMPPWKLVLSNEEMWKVMMYEQTFLSGMPIEVPISDQAPPKYAEMKNPFHASEEVLSQGRFIYMKRCRECHGTGGEGDGPAAGLLEPKPVNLSDKEFAEFTDGQWFYRVSEGVEATHMPPWKLVLSNEERWKVIAYARTFAQEGGK